MKNLPENSLFQSNIKDLVFFHLCAFILGTVLGWSDTTASQFKKGSIQIGLKNEDKVSTTYNKNSEVRYGPLFGLAKGITLALHGLKYPSQPFRDIPF